MSSKQLPHRRFVTRSITVTASAAIVAAAVTLSACSSGKSDNGSAAIQDPSSSSTADPHAASVTITAADGCKPDKTTFDAGGITFNITNKDATAVSEVELLDGERIVGEKENVPPPLGGSFAVKVDAGQYVLYCPGATDERTTLTVTGQASSANTSTAQLLQTATTGYSDYVSTQVGYLLQSTEVLAKSLHGTNLAAAQVAYKKSRPFYEKIEPVAESFTSGKDNLDADIDARAGDVPAAQWQGFHRIEKGLFAEKSLTGLATYGDGLVANVKKLQSLTTGLKYQPTELANGAQELLDEVASSKITGEEERYSHIDLLDFANNDEGAEQAFAQLTPALKQIDPALTAEIQTNFDALDTLVDKYRSDTEPSGYVLYTSLTASDKRALAAAVKAVQEPLSQVSSKVANA
jgi:iron uptake system component EfeO